MMESSLVRYIASIPHINWQNSVKLLFISLGVRNGRCDLLLCHALVYLCISRQMRLLGSLFVNLITDTWQFSFP